MNGVNKVILVGNACGDAEPRTLQNGGKVVNFTLATNESWKDKNSGEWKNKAEFHRIVIFNEHLANAAEKIVKKGNMLAVEGAIQTRKWEKDGQTHYTTEVVLQKFRGELTLLDSKRDSSDSGYGGGGSDYSQDLDDGIPFLVNGDWPKRSIA